MAKTSSNAHLVFFLAQVEKAGSIVEETLFRAFQAICEYSEQHDPSSKRPTLIFDPVNSAVWIKLVKGSQVMSEVQLRIIGIKSKDDHDVSKVLRLLCELSALLHVLSSGMMLYIRFCLCYSALLQAAHSLICGQQMRSG